MYLEITVLWARIIEIKSLSRELTFLHFPPIEINFKNWAWISSNSRQLYLSMGRNYVHKKWRHQLALQLNVFVSHCVCLVKIYIYWLVMKPCDADRLPFPAQPDKINSDWKFFFLVFFLSLIKTVWRFFFLFSTSSLLQLHRSMRIERVAIFSASRLKEDIIHLYL